MKLFRIATISVAVGLATLRNEQFLRVMYGYLTLRGIYVGKNSMSTDDFIKNVARIATVMMSHCWISHF